MSDAKIRMFGFLVEMKRITEKQFKEYTGMSYKDFLKSDIR